MSRKTFTSSVVALAKQGMTQKQICDRLNCKYKAVYNAIYRSRKCGLLENKPRSNGWSDAELDAFRDAIVEQRMSSGQAADFMSKKFGRTFTRNMIVGMAGRMGLELCGGVAAWRAAMDERRPARKQQRKVIASRVSVAAPSRVAARKRKEPKANPPPPTIVAPVDCDWNPRRVPLMKIRDGMCRFPIGDPRSADFTFCGNHTDIGKTYCLHCHGIVYETAAARAEKRKKWLLARGLVDRADCNESAI